MKTQSSNLKTPLDEPGRAPSADASIDERAVCETQRMGDDDLARSSALSLRSATPPLHVPGFEQEEFVGRGAFGEVWKAIDSNSGREVAIKFYNHRGGLDWSHMTREVEKLQYLFSDRYVVQLFDVGWDADPPYYVMEYMEHGSLEDRLRDGPMTVQESVHTIREIAVGLAHAHDKGILHCDLKPGNVMLDQDGRPRLADFGQARLQHEHSPALGTLFYMAPEQADLSAAPDARWDVYALGAILYRMITGEVPYYSEAVSQEISSHDSLEERLKSYSDLATKQAKPVAHRKHPDVDKSLADLIDGCLEVDPRRRFPNVQAVLQSLEMRESRKAQQSMILLGIVGPLLVVGLMAVAAVFFFNHTLDTARRNILDRTAESNRFAAQSVGDRFGLEVDKRWRILEQEAQSPVVLEALQASDQLSSLQSWLELRHQYWNKQFTQNTRASYWFILDRQGRVQAISPLASSLIGSYFGYREYFHGQGKELSPYAAVPEMIDGPHRSNIFLSQPDNVPAVAFSVPIWLESREQPLGILVMETEMGHFAEFTGSRNQLAVLIDLRPDETGRPGLIVEHPELGQSFERLVYLDQSQLNAMRRACQSASSSSADAMDPPPTLRHYRDPVSDESEGNDWLASVAPVEVVRGNGQKINTDWAILVQEKTSQTLLPLEHVKGLFYYGGIASLVIATLIIGGLWWIVLYVAKQPGRLRKLQLWGRTLTLRSLSSLSTSHTPQPTARATSTS